jgi:GDP-D-mannose dehydratase
MNKTSLIVGISGIVGRNLADVLVAQKDWAVYGHCQVGARKKVAEVDNMLCS